MQSKSSLPSPSNPKVATSNHILCCGDNFFGQLGIGYITRGKRSDICTFGNPSDILDSNLIVQNIYCGSQYSIVLYKDGNFKICGSLNGSVFPLLTYVPIQFPLKCIQIACGRKHIIALLEGHFVLSWGVGYFGQLGHGDDISWDSPRMVRALEPRLLGASVTSVYCGGAHSGAVTDTGRVFMWGFNKYGQCGVSLKSESILEPKPIDTSQLGGAAHATQLVLGRNHSAMLTAVHGPKGSRLYAWGANGYGRLGIASEARKYVTSPLEVPFFREIDVVSLVSGDFHMLALDSQSNVYSWGWGAEGQTGFGNTNNLKLPRKMDFFDDMGVCSIACGSGWSMATTTKGELYAWGYGDGGWLGMQNTDSTSKLPFLEQPESPNTVDISKSPAGMISRCCSFDSTLNVLMPQLVTSVSMNYFVTKVICGGAHTVVLCRDRETQLDIGKYNSKMSYYTNSLNGSSKLADHKPQPSSSSSSKSDVKSSSISSVLERMSEEDLAAQLISWCRHGHRKDFEIEYALSRGVQTEHRDAAGNTALLVACQNGHIDICKLLVAYGADVNCSNLRGNTALHFCFSYNFEDIGKYLISAGADEFAVNHEGLTCYEGLTFKDLELI